MAGIFRRRRGWATWPCVAVLACGGRATAPEAATPAQGGTRVVPIADAIVLASSGASAADTTVTFVAGQARTIVLRHRTADRLVFAELEFPPGAFALDSGSTVSIDIRPRPGVYGLDLRASAPLKQGVWLTFKYPRYFSAPADARAAFGGDVLFERALAIGRLERGARLALLPSSRPASDNLRARIREPGGYLVAAAR